MFGGMEGAGEAYGADSSSVKVELHQWKLVSVKAILTGYTENPLLKTEGLNVPPSESSSR
jgi:hypothetical protein